jgi:hypothetical protein
VKAELLKLETKWDERAADLSEGAMECAVTGERSDERALMRRVNEINRCINDLRAFRVRVADAALVSRAPQQEQD